MRIDQATPFTAAVPGTALLLFETDPTNPDPLLRGYGNIPRASFVRELLQQDRTYYVATTGSDSNDGLTPGTPFLTAQKAIDTICDTLDLGGFNVTVQLADGTYTAGMFLYPYVGGTGEVTIQGNAAATSNVLFSISAAGHTGGRGVFTNGTGGARWFIQNLKIQTSGSGDNGARIDGPSYVVLTNVNFGACVSTHLFATFGAIVRWTGTNTVTGGGVRLLGADQGARLFVSSSTITLTGTPAFSSRTCSTENGASCSFAGATFVGGATGTRYFAATNGVINTAGGGPNFIPGNVAGSVATGGQYV